MTVFGPRLLTYDKFSLLRGLCMGESGGALIRPVILAGVHVRSACGAEQAVLCGASSRRCKPFWISACLRPRIGYDTSTSCSHS